MMRAYRLVFIICLLLTFFASNAQRYPFHNLNVEDGLLQSQVRAITQDKFGYLWVGTLGGLSRYDGQNFTGYTIRNGLPDNTVTALHTGEDGTVWIGTAEGLCAYDGKNYYRYKLAASAVVVNSIISDDKNSVWCVAGGNLYHAGKGKSVHIPLPIQNISSLIADGNNLMLANNNGLFRKRGNTLDSIPYPITGMHTFAMYRDNKKRLLLGTNAGLYIMGDTAMRPYTQRGNMLQLPPIVSMAEDKSGNLWLGLGSGAAKLTDSSVIYYNKKNGLTDNIISDAYTDAEGNVWLASDGQGIFRYSGVMFTLMDEKSGLPSGQVTGITKDRYGRIFFGTYDAGVSIYAGGNLYPVRFSGDNIPTVTAMEVTEGDKVWVGTMGSGLWYFNGISIRPHSAPSAIIFSLYTDAEDKLWVGTANGAGYYEDNIYKTVYASGAPAQAFWQLSNDSMLIAAGNGLKVYTKGNVNVWKTNTVADSVTAQCLLVHNGKVWIGSSDNGIVVYDMATKKSIAIGKAEGLRSEFIYNLVAANDGSVWAGTGFGIHRIALKDGKTSIQFFGKEQGLKGMESNHNAVYKMPDGSIWFGTTNGVVHYKQGSQMLQPKPISIAMKSVEVFGETIRDTTYFDSVDSWNNVPYNLQLPYRKNNITFTYQGITLGGSQQLLYRYRINGLDAPWSDWSRVNTVTYSALPPGKYNFVVQCKTGDDTEMQELKYPFTIVAPFHKTSLFRLLVLAGCIALGISIQYIVNRRKLNRAKLLERLRKEEQAKVRQRTAEDFHDELGNKLTRINVLTNVLKNKLGKDNEGDKQRILEQIQDNTKQLYGGTRDILWSLQPANDNLYEIVNRVGHFGQELFSDTEIKFHFTGSDERLKQYKLPMDKSRNLIMIFKEAFNNALKYADAENIWLEANIINRNALQLKLKDDGNGFDIHYVKKGHGIDNMTVRSKRLEGRMYIDSSKGKGTILTLTFKLPSNRG